MISLDDLITPVTTDEQLENFLSTLETIGVRARSWRQGGSLRTILRVVAGTYAGFSNVSIEFIRSGFLDLARNGWLTLLARYVFNVERIEATFAVGTVTLSNAGGASYPTVQPGALRVVNPTTKKVYTNTAVFTLASGPGTSADVDVQAVEIGSASNSAAGAITDFETVLDFPGVTVTNATAVIGSDDELDPDLRQRCRDKLGTLSGLGPRGAYQFAVRSAVRDDGSKVDVNRLAISPSSSTGTVTVTVASPSGAPPLADLDFIRAAIELYARPDSVTAIVNAANPVAYSKALTVWATRTDGVSAADLEALVDAALIAMILDYPIGGHTKPPSVQGYLFASKIEGAAMAAHPSIFAIDGVGSDIALAVSDVVTLATTITVRLAEVV